MGEGRGGMTKRSGRKVDAGRKVDDGRKVAWRGEVGVGGGVRPLREEEEGVLSSWQVAKEV